MKNVNHKRYSTSFVKVADILDNILPSKPIIDNKRKENVRKRPKPLILPKEFDGRLEDICQLTNSTENQIERIHCRVRPSLIRQNSLSNVKSNELRPNDSEGLRALRSSISLVSI